MTTQKPKIALIGYGKMGKEIEHLAIEKGFILTDIFDIDKPLVLGKNYDFDVAIEFTTPTAVFENIKTIAKMKKNIVVGTTGWYDRLEEVKRIVEQEQIGLIYSPNFSVGIQILLKTVEQISKFINSINNYDILIEEIHHRHKKDAPSGTALLIAKKILENIKSKERITTNPLDVDENSLQIASLRFGEVFGVHKILFDSEFDTIEITHTAKNRKGFALGALLAAVWIHNQKGFFEFSV